MSVKKIIFVFGTRPEAIKMAPLVKEFQKNSSDFNVKVCVTAQHREMLDQVLSLFDIVPDFDLNLMKFGQDLYDITSSVLLSLRYILNDIKPDYVFVHGDTTTTFSASLAAYYQKIPVVHIEAGLRSSNIYSPFPEEINRVLTSKIAKYHFSPTFRAAENLISEGVDKTNIFITGNTVIDALFQVTKRIENENISIKGYNFNSRKIILVTGHRRENFGQGFLDICDALSLLAKKYPEIDIVYPVHLNPNVNAPVKKLLDNIKNIFLIEPLEYIDFVYLMNRSYIILTDSGGIQEEAPSLGKPVLVMRENTERPEAVEAGTVKLVGTSSAMIVKHTSDLLDDDHYYLSMSQAHNPYGDGNSSKKITETFKTLVSL